MKRDSKRYQFLLATHKYLGLATGLVVLLVSLTGAAWVFKDEVEAFTEPAYDIVLASEQQSLTPSRARELAKAVFPNNHVHGTLFQSVANTPVEVIFYDAEPLFYQSVFLHPYSGEVLWVKDHFSGFFAWALRGHMYLWLPPTVGHNIVKYGILLFLFIIFSGLLIWLPGKVKKLRKNLSFRWKPTTGWRRKNYDLHSIIGVYIYTLAFLFAFTGSVIGLPWFYYVVFKAAGGDNNPRFVVPASTSSAATNEAQTVHYDQLIAQLRREEPDASGFELHYPGTDSTSVYVEVSHGKGLHYNNDYRFFDQRTLEELPSNSIYAKYADADLADMVIRMNYDIHVGAIGGLPGKIIAFIASLIVASLPLTGALIWYGRRKKMAKTRSKSSAIEPR